MAEPDASQHLPWIDSTEVARLLPMPAAIEALERALLGGLDPSTEPPRTAVDLRHGQLLLMPSQTPGAVGVKLVSVAPGNADRGLPRVQGIYLLMDAETLRPVALIDGIAITSLRTPAMSAVAVRHLAAPDASRLVLFGTGPQAWGHVEALLAVRPVADVVVVGHDPRRTAGFAEQVCATGLPASVGTPEAVRDADLVVCATTAGEPVFDGRLVRDGACVVAVGSHEPHRRELDAGLMGRATVVVEDMATALREAGDVIQAISAGALVASEIATIADVVRGRATMTKERPSVFKSVGMAWQDLVAAAEIHRRWAGS